MQALHVIARVELADGLAETAMMWIHFKGRELPTEVAEAMARPFRCPTKDRDVVIDPLLVLVMPGWVKWAS